MLGDVLEAAVRTRAAHVRLVTDDAAAVESRVRSGSRSSRIPAAARAQPCRRRSPDVDGCLPRRQRRRAAAPSDSPRSPAPARAAPALVAAADGTTNALALPDRTWFQPLYGPGSAAQFAAARPRPASIPELEHDVDTLLDLERLDAAARPADGPRVESTQGSCGSTA